MSHDHGHQHHGHTHHGHAHGPASYGRAFAIGITLNLAFVLAEIIYGSLAHSMALLADAGHNSSDVLKSCTCLGGKSASWSQAIAPLHLRNAAFLHFSCSF